MAGKVCHNTWNDSNTKIQNNNRNAWNVFVNIKKYNMIEQVIRLKKDEYGCAIILLLGFSHVLNGNK